MIMDQEAAWSRDQAVRGTSVSTNTVSTGSLVLTPYGENAPLRFKVVDLSKSPLNGLGIAVNVTVPFNNLTSLAIAIETGDIFNGGLSDAVEIYRSAAYSLSDLNSGRLLEPTVFPRGIYRRWTQIRYIVVGTAPTSGSISAGVVLGDRVRVN